MARKIDQMTPELKREKKRKKRNYYYVVDPDTNEVQRRLGKPTKKPKAVIYLPHYEDSLRIEVDLPEGDPADIQKDLEEYKSKFVNWFGGTKETGYNWGNKTRRYVWNKLALRVKGVKLSRTENRALRTLFMYKGILDQFRKGKERKSVVKDIAEHKKFSFEQVRKINDMSRKTGVVLKTHRKPSTINRDITSLVKVGILERTGVGKYKVNEDKLMGLKKTDGFSIA